MADDFKFVQAQPFTLAGAGVIVGATTMTLNSFKGINGVNLTMTDFGTVGYGTVQPGNSVFEEQISFTGVTQNSNGTATLTGISTVLFIAPYTETSGFASTHTGGSTFVISNTAGFYNKLTSKADDETITGTWTFPTTDPTRAGIGSDVDTAVATAFVTLGQLSRQAISGASNASTTVKGIVELATQAEVDARSTTGGTGALLVPTPERNRTVLTHDYVASVVGTDAYAIAPTPAVTAYTTGDVYYFKADVANTGACTLNVAGLGAKALKVNGTLDPQDGYIGIGSLVKCQYDGTNMQILSVAAKPSVSQNGTEIYGADAGANDTYVITVAPVPAAYVDGEVFRFKANTVNTGAATLNVNSLGAITILRPDGSALANGDISANMVLEVVYRSGSFYMLSPVANSPKINSGVFTKNLSDANTTQTIAHGLGRTPRYIKIQAGYGLATAMGALSTVTYDGVNTAASYIGQNNSTILDGSSTSNFIIIGTTTSTQISGVITMDATNISIAWTKTNSPTNVAYGIWEAFA